MIVWSDPMLGEEDRQPIGEPIDGVDARLEPLLLGPSFVPIAVADLGDEPDPRGEAPEPLDLIEPEGGIAGDEDVL